MIDDIHKDARQRMAKSVEMLKQEFSKVRTGRANAGLLDHVSVDYYGSEVPISQVATVNVEDARTLSITPWEKDMVAVVEKAIINSDLGLTPNTAGPVIRINLPPLTEERRRDLVKVIKGEAEQARVAVRNIRRDANQQIKELAKEKMISDDDEKRAEAEVQKLTDEFVGKVDAATDEKEQEMLSICRGPDEPGAPTTRQLAGSPPRRGDHGWQRALGEAARQGPGRRAQGRRACGAARGARLTPARYRGADAVRVQPGELAAAAVGGHAADAVVPVGTADPDYSGRLYLLHAPDAGWW